MGYGKRDLVRMKLGHCLDCGERMSGNYRRCIVCRESRSRKREQEIRRLYPALRRECVRLRAEVAELKARLEVANANS